MAVDPHTYATGVPTVIQGFIVYLVYYLLVRYKLVNLVNGNLIIYVGAMVGLFYLNDLFFVRKIGSYKKRWSSENNKKLKGYAIAVFAVCSFIGILLVANGLHKLKTS